MLEFRELYIGGKWEQPHEAGLRDVISPFSEAAIGRTPSVSVRDIDRAVAAARAAFDSGEWPTAGIEARAKCVRALRDGLARRSAAVTDIIAMEAGLPVKMWARVDIALSIIDYYLGLARGLAETELRHGPTGDVLVQKSPVGVTAAIVPWNAPLNIAVIKIVPALLAGCTVILKADPHTPLHAFALAEVIDEAGFPPGVINVVPAGRAESAELVEHLGVDHVSFTGSSATGRIVGRVCGQQLKRCTLELGGKSAAIVLDDVQLEKQLPRLVGATFMNNGEACVLQSRVLAPRSRYAEIAEALAAGASTLVVGDPNDPNTDVGPLITAAHRERVEALVDRAVDSGAKVVTGAARPKTLTHGWFYEPTVLADVVNGDEIAQEEVFGPVVVVVPYDDDDHAVELANDSPYGLSGTVWTSDHDRGLDIARRVDTGNYGINTFGMDPSAPFGGMKQSGLGSELGPEGLHEFLKSKSIHLPRNWRGATPGQGSK
ncbi:aldehyde dehydrogenase [Mycobacterium kyogaense]|uniref:aldehyde dehydrogenase n=1 Tax=Mycobacterium kyogaense TaxID=2212479 RepID=UPI000DABDA01|nr:aldehyde dehydrogenase [Mycobacterium kyogaense]